MRATAAYMDHVSEAMSIRYNNLVYERKGRGEDVIVLSLGEAFFDIPLQPFTDLPFPDIYHYSHSRGLAGLREKIASYYHSEYGVHVDAESEIIVTAGSKAAIFMALMAILDVGDEVIIPEPAWVSYKEQVLLCRGEPVMVPFQRKICELEEFVTPRTRAIILNFPHNPTGRMLERSELEFLHDLAQRRGLYLLSDEAYSDFVLDDDRFLSCASLDPEKRRTIVFNSMSKNYGISGWRIGYVISNPEITYAILKINQHLITCPGTILAHYVNAHFDELLAITKPQIRQVVEKRNSIADYAEARGLELRPGSATFYLFVSIERSSLGSEEFSTRLLRESHVSVVPGVGYGESCDGFVRVSIGTESVERTKQGIDRISKMIEHTAR